MLVTDLDRFRRDGAPADPAYPAEARTLYSPIDDVHGALVALLSSVRKSLVVAVYGYDDDELAAIIARHLANPKVYCQITLDKSQAGGVHERAILEKFGMKASNSVAIGNSERGQIMHRKMAVIDGLWRITGSTNWSISGETKQDNELTVTRNSALAAEARHVLDLEHQHILTNH